MPYKNIHWIKLEKRLLNDYRFYTMSEDSQLIFVKFLMLAADTGNRMVRSMEVLKQALRSNLTPIRLQECIDEIKAHFPKFQANRYYYYFKEFDNRLNWIEKESAEEQPGDSSGTAKVGVDKKRIRKRKDKKRKEKIVYLTPTTLEKSPLKDYEKNILKCFLELDYSLDEKKLNDFVIWLGELQKDYPDKDLLINAKKWRDYFENKPPKSHKNSFRNWVSKDYADKKVGGVDDLRTKSKEFDEMLKKLPKKPNEK